MNLELVNILTNFPQGNTNHVAAPLGSKSSIFLFFRIIFSAHGTIECLE